jgi:cellulose biosynthesis protein BcsQ
VTTARPNAALSRVVLVANQKGGVGKSSIVAAVAGMLARPDRRVLVVDADQQGNVSRNDLGVDGDRGRSLGLTLAAGDPLTPVRDVRPGLDVVPGGPILAQVAATAGRAGGPGGTGTSDGSPTAEMAGNLARRLGELCAEQRYALTLIDSGPGDAPLLDVLLDVSRYLLVPSCDDEASFDGVDLLAGRYLRSRARGSGVDLLGVVLFNVNPRATVRNAEVLRSLSALLEGSGAEPFRTIVRTDKATALDARRRHLTPAELVVESGKEKTSRLRQLATGRKVESENRLWSRDPSGLANDYQSLARELLGRVAVYEGRHRATPAAPTAASA